MFSKWVFFTNLFFLAACTSSSDSSRLPTAKVERQDLVQRISISGTIEPKRMALVTAPYDSYVRKIFVSLGDEVKQGDPLVSLSENITDPGPFFPLRAPFPGRVVQVAMAENEHAKGKSQEEYILRIDDQSEFHISSSVPEVDILKLQKGQEAIIRASAISGKQYKGEVRSISLSPARPTHSGRRGQDSVSFPVEIGVLDPDSKIRGGMSAIVDIVAARKDAVLVLPHEYIAQDRQEYFVTTVDGTRKTVELGLRNEIFSEVMNLEEGEEIRQVDFYDLQESQ